MHPPACVEKQSRRQLKQWQPATGPASAVAAQTERDDESCNAAFSVLERIGKLKKEAAVAHHSLSYRNALENLRLAILACSHFDITPAKLVCSAGNVDERLVIVIAKNRCVGHGKYI